jgi:hypothetical protein
MPVSKALKKRGADADREVKIIFISANAHQARLRIELEDTRVKDSEGDF